VFELPELNQTVRVSEDGSISLIMLGKIEVAGLDRPGDGKEAGRDPGPAVHEGRPRFGFHKRISESVRPRRRRKNPACSNSAGR